MGVDAVHAALTAGAGLVGWGVARWAPGPPSPLGPRVRAGLAAAAVAGGAIGAKAPFVLFDPASWTSHGAWLTDGRTLVWGLAGGYGAVEATKAALGVTSRTGDGFAAPVAATVAVGRLGCFWSGCCYGLPTALPWGVDFGDGVPRHPTQLYEAGFHALCALVLVGLGRRGVLPDRRFQVYLLAYCGYRFLTEWLRPEAVFAFGLTVYQGSVLVIGAWMLAVLYRRRDPVPQPG